MCVQPELQGVDGFHNFTSSLNFEGLLLSRKHNSEEQH